MDIDPRVLPDSQNEGEGQEPQQTPEGEVTPENTEVLELKRKAEVSSQNFERAKKAELEVKELRKLLEEKKPSEPDYLISDEDQTKKEILELRKELNSFKETNILQKLGEQYPAIKDKGDEFNEFRAEYPGVALDKVAKIFISEKGYVEQLVPRKGLEKPTGGQKSQQKSGIDVDEVNRLRETQPRRYQSMLRSGKINPDEIN